MNTELTDPKVREWLGNAGQNAVQVSRDISEWPGNKRKYKAALILGAGASLQRLEDSIAQLAQQTLTIVSPTVLPWFIHHTAQTPDLLINVDKHPWLANVVLPYTQHHWNLALSPVVSPVWLEVPGVKWWYLGLTQGSDGKLTSSVFSQAMTAFFPQIKTTIGQLGCVTNEAIWLTYLQMGRLGLEAIILAGCDYGYWRGKARVPTVAPFDRYADVEPTEDVLLVDRVRTNKAMLAYRYQLALLQETYQMPIYDMSDGTMNGMFPRVTARDVLRWKLPKYWSPARTKKAAKLMVDRHRELFEG